jgi:hypothetical protein
MAETETKETTFRFEDIDDTTVKVSVLNGSSPFEVTLKNVTWGLLEDIMTVQETSKDDPRAIFAFLNEHVEGGGKAIPLKYTMSFFESIAEYMSQVMDTQKN